MEPSLAAQAVILAAEDNAGTVVESDSNEYEQKPRPPSQNLVRSTPDMMINIEHVLADFGVITNADVEATIERRLTKWTSTQQSQVLKAVESTFEESLQSSYFNSNIGLKPTMYKVVEQALGEMVRSGRAHTSSETGVRNSEQTNYETDNVL